MKRKVFIIWVILTGFLWGQGRKSDLKIEGEELQIRLFQAPSHYPAILYDSHLIPKDYKISPGDELTITFYGYFNINTIQWIPPHGRIVIFGEDIPSLGVFEVMDKTAQEVEKEINERLERMNYPETQAIVSITKLGSIRIYIVGNIPKPGSYLVSPLSRVTDVIIYTQGIDFNLKEVKKVVIKRGNFNKIEFDLKKFLEKGDSTNNPLLQDNDIIMIYRDSLP